VKTLREAIVHNGELVLFEYQPGPRHVFVFIINNANINDRAANPFLYNTFSISTDQSSDSQFMLFGSWLCNKYPENRSKPSTKPTRDFMDVEIYSWKR